MATSVDASTGGRPILIGLGANLSSPWGAPRETLKAALARLPDHGVTLIARSRFYRSAPVPPSDQPWFVNAVAIVDTGLSPEALLAALLAIESHFGRVRGERWSARCLDIDLIDYRGMLRSGAAPPELPHPRLHERAFVLHPLAELLPDWRHPKTAKPITELLAELPADQAAEPAD